MKKKSSTVCKTFSSIGVEIIDGIMFTIFSKDQKLPCESTVSFTTVEDEQRDILVKVYEGENYFVKNNRLLGKFWIKGLPILPRNQLKIQINFKFLKNRILKIIVQEKKLD